MIYIGLLFFQQNDLSVAGASWNVVRIPVAAVGLHDEVRGSVWVISTKTMWHTAAGLDI